MSSQTLHRDYYPLALIQVGLHYALVELPDVLTGRRDVPTGKEALAIRRIFSLFDIITKAKFSNSPNDFKTRLFGLYNMYS